MTGDVYPGSRKPSTDSSQQPVGHRNIPTTHLLESCLPSPGCDAGAVISAWSGVLLGLLFGMLGLRFQFWGFSLWVSETSTPKGLLHDWAQAWCFWLPLTLALRLLRPSATTKQAPRMRKTARIFGVAAPPGARPRPVLSKSFGYNLVYK